ncbi:MAG: phosphate ABC transporter substrate-binding protein PstS [Spirochaetaceae bacterium]|nr:MAG: phosphate ABC transporter substrate-binding protein PstS [Spirochaetaceae bacterium]
MRMSKVLLAALLATTVAAFGFAGGGKEQAAAPEGAREFARVELLGAGASFPAPLITAWADEYRDLTRGAVTINYQSIGSGGGVRQFMEQTIMFGASEAALSDANAELAKANTGGVAYNMPITLGDVAMTYNLPGVTQQLVFNPDTIAGAFLGEITRWNDPKIAALNPGVNLPNLPIQIAHRSDGSGTTNIFTNYLTKVNRTWADNIGFGSSVNWPVGTGGNGNEGVAGIVSSTPGALGYNSLVYAVLNEIAYGKVVNNSGRTIDPSLEATSLAAAVQIPADGRIMLTDTDARDGYPIAGFAWALVYENLDRNSAITNRDQAVELTRFLYWTITEGQNINESLSFARLPTDAQAVAEQMLSTVKWQGEPVGRQVIDDIKANGW